MTSTPENRRETGMHPLGWRRLRARLSPYKARVYRLIRRLLRRMMRTIGRVNDYEYVFIVTYGRSGSTLLMGLLNTIPGYRIRGENYNAMYRLYQADAAITKAHERFSGRGNAGTLSAWYGTPSARPHLFRAGLIDNFVENVLRPEPGDRVLGFKEIRHTPVHMDDLTEYLAFLRRTFPRCRIVFNHRDPAAAARSAWWVNINGAEETIRAADERLLTFPADARHFHFFYEQIDASLDNIRALFRFLGEEVDEAAVRAVLDTSHAPYTAPPGIGLSLAGRASQARANHAGRRRQATATGDGYTARAG